MWPTVVVLDTERTMEFFRRYAREQGKPDDLPDDMVGEIIACFRRRRTAELRLDEFVAAIVGGEFQYPLGQYVDIGVAGFILELGEVILEQLTSHCLYDEYGYLPYRSSIPKHKNFNNVVLRRVSRDHLDRPMLYEQTTTKRRF